MPENNIKQSMQNKKKLAVPQTDSSLGDDKSTRNFVLAILALIFVLILGGGAVLYWLIGNYVKQTNKNKAQDETIVLLEQKKQDLEALRPNYEKIKSINQNGKSEADLILNAMPTDEGFRQFIAMIENMAQKSGVKVSSLTKPQESIGASAATGATAKSTNPLPKGAKTSQVTIPIQGTFDNVLNFLEATENSSRVMDFVSMNISSQTGNISVSPVFSIYWQLPADISSTQKELK